MTALTASYDARRKDGALIAYPVAGARQVHKGGLTAVASATGLAQPAGDVAGIVFIGVAYEGADNGTGAAGAKTVRVLKTGVFTYAKTGASAGDVGKTAFVVDDATVATAPTADSIPCGVVVGVPDALSVQVRIDAAVR